jgi:Domain of unknown function (DUF4406)
MDADWKTKVLIDTLEWADDVRFLDEVPRDKRAAVLALLKDGRLLVVDAETQDVLPKHKGHKYILVRDGAAPQKPNYDECIRQANTATGIKQPSDAWMNVFIREINRWCYQCADYATSSGYGEHVPIVGQSGAALPEQQATPQFSTEYTNGYTVGHADGYASCLRRVERGQDDVGTGAAPGSLDFLKSVGDALNGGHREIIDECSGPISQAAVDVLCASAARCEEKAQQSADTSEWKGDPYLFRQVSPLPEIDYKSPLAYQWTAGEVLYAGRSFGALSEKDKECVENGLLPPDEAPQPASNGWPSYIKWREQTPPPPKLGTGIKTEASSIKPYIDVEIGHDGKKYSGYVDVRESLILARDLEVISNKLKAKDGNRWPDYIQWHPSAPESPPRWGRVKVMGNAPYKLTFNDKETGLKYGDVPSDHADDFVQFMRRLNGVHQSTKRPRIYIAGPMSGLPELNFPAFHAEAARLRALGYEVVNPAEINAEHPGDWASCLKADIAQMLTCDGIAMLHGWTESRGATLEHSLAQTLGMVIHYKAITQEVL